MKIKAKISIDDDRWAKHPFSISFDDEECASKYAATSLNSWEDCYRRINQAKSAGFDIDDDIEEVFY